MALIPCHSYVKNGSFYRDNILKKSKSLVIVTYSVTFSVNKNSRIILNHPLKTTNNLQEMVPKKVGVPE
jgi:hypothetical protein